MIILFIAAACVAAAPLVAVVLVAVASHHEDAARSLAGRPPGRVTATARWLLSDRLVRRRRARRTSQADRRQAAGRPSGRVPGPRPAADDLITARASRPVAAPPS